MLMNHLQEWSVALAHLNQQACLYGPHVGPEQADIGGGKRQKPLPRRSTNVYLVATNLTHCISC